MLFLSVKVVACYADKDVVVTQVCQQRVYLAAPDPKVIFVYLQIISNDMPACSADTPRLLVSYQL